MKMKKMESRVCIHRQDGIMVGIMYCIVRYAGQWGKERGTERDSERDAVKGVGQWARKKRKKKKRRAAKRRKEKKYYKKYYKKERREEEKEEEENIKVTPFIEKLEESNISKIDWEIVLYNCIELVLSYYWVSIELILCGVCCVLVRVWSAVFAA